MQQQARVWKKQVVKIAGLHENRHKILLYTHPARLRPGFSREAIYKTRQSRLCPVALGTPDTSSLSFPEKGI